MSERINPDICPYEDCGELACRDYNRMPQEEWQRSEQRWHCDSCGRPLVRTFDYGMSYYESRWRVPENN